jgi:aminoglycoside N3'-acetyltransferase
MLARFKSSIKSSRLFAELRKIKYRRARKKSNNKVQLSLGSIRKILVNDLSVRQGDNLIVHCGFGFLRADFSPLDLIELLKELVGAKGSIVMPFYPLGLSSDWARAGREFNINTVRCSTGILAQIFSTTDVLTSIHPIKSVCVWGEKAEQLISEHQYSQYPFDDKSPYYKLAMLDGSKSIGLGVRNCAMLHCAEDMFEENKNYLYTENRTTLKIITPNSTNEVATHYHHGDIKLQKPYEYIDQHCSDSVTVINKMSVTYYAIDNKNLLDKCSVLFAKGVNRKCL